MRKAHLTTSAGSPLRNHYLAISAGFPLRKPHLTTSAGIALTKHYLAIPVGLQLRKGVPQGDTKKSSNIKYVSNRYNPLRSSANCASTGCPRGNQKHGIFRNVTAVIWGVHCRNRVPTSCPQCAPKHIFSETLVGSSGRSTTSCSQDAFQSATQSIELDTT